MSPICHIIGAGEICTTDLDELKKRTKKDYIIAADGGFHFLAENNILPDILIGDFDSCDELAIHIPENLPIHRLNPIKDYTDMHTSIQHGLDKGFKNFRLYGAVGGRIDHTIANIQLLSWLASLDCHARMYGRENTFDILRNGEIHFPASMQGFISVFSLTEKSTGVYETGLKYELENATLTSTFPLGVSNEFINAESSIKVTEGTLLIVSPR